MNPEREFNYFDDDTEARAFIVSLPQYTLIRTGWGIAATEAFREHVCGQVYYRVADGLGPLGRDDSTERQLRRASQTYMPHLHQRYAVQILALPLSESESPDESR